MVFAPVTNLFRRWLALNSRHALPTPDARDRQGDLQLAQRYGLLLHPAARSLLESVLQGAASTAKLKLLLLLSLRTKDMTMQQNVYSISRRDALAALGGATLLTASAFAQSGRSVRMLTASTAGATIDVIARTTQPTLARHLGAPVVVENVAGASGVIAMQTLARAAPDGATLVFHTNNLVIVPNVMKTSPYDAASDFTPIAIVGSIPLVLVANAAKVSATNAREFVELIKSKPGDLTYGSSGSGTTLHMAMEMILEETGAKMTHIPYRGVAPMVNDLLGGQTQFCISGLGAALPHIKAGTLRAISLCAPQRVAIAPNIPTFGEQGFPNFVMDCWLAVLGPKGMAAPVVKRIHEALAVTFNDPAVRQELEKQGNIIQVTTPEKALAMIRQDTTKYAELARKINLMQG